MNWFLYLPLLMKVFWGCALVSSVFFVLQTILSLIGIGADDMDIDTDFSSHDGFLGEALEMFTLRNMVNFFLGFGWAGICFRETIEHDAVLVTVSVVVGVLFVALFVVIMKKLMRLERNGKFDPEADVVGKTADCYLHIPVRGEGKIQLSVNGSVHEFTAVSDDDIPTGTKVRVLSLVSQGTYKVERIIK